MTNLRSNMTPSLVPPFYVAPPNWKGSWVLRPLLRSTPPMARVVDGTRPSMNIQKGSLRLSAGRLHTSDKVAVEGGETTQEAMVDVEHRPSSHGDAAPAANLPTALGPDRGKAAAVAALRAPAHRPPLTQSRMTGYKRNKMTREQEWAALRNACHLPTLC